MLPNRQTLLCHYRYDPLDRLVDCTPTAQTSTQRFYLKNRLATEIEGATRRSIMQHDDQLLAQQQRQGSAVETRLLASDQQRSVLNVLDRAQRHALAYSPYGHRPLSNGLLSLLGFNGERPDPVTGCYLLGNGYRAFNSVLMRFVSPDSLSPFSKGGLNSYTYCLGDPINFADPTGHMLGLKSLFGLRKTTTPAKPATLVPHGKMANVKNLAEEAFTFETTHKKGSRLTITAHGSESSPGHIEVGDKLWSARDIMKNVDLKPYDRIRVLACYSDEIGAEIALTMGKEVKAYKGPVQVDIPLDTAENFYHHYNDHVKLSEMQHTALIIRKQNLYNPKTEASEYAKFNYQPVKFKL